MWFGSGVLPWPIPSCGGRRKTAVTSLDFAGRFLPARTKKGTPLQRQLSTSSSSAAKVSVVDFGSTSLTSRKPSYWPRT